MTIKRLRNLAIDERGSVESHLMIIPLTILFLLTLQLTALSSWQLGKVSDIESGSNKAAIVGRETSNGSASTLWHSSLAGGGRLTVIEDSREIPLLANFARLIPGLSLSGVFFRHRSVSLSEIYTQ